MTHRGFLIMRHTSTRKGAGGLIMIGNASVLGTSSKCANHRQWPLVVRASHQG